MRASIDLLTDKLERQVNRYREKRRLAPRRESAAHKHANGDVPDLAMPEPVAEDAPMVSKTKRFTMIPMSPEEAVAPARARRPRLLRLPQRPDAARSTSSTGARTTTYGLIEPD